MKGFEFDWISPKGDPVLILGTLAAVTFLVAVVTFASYRFRRWQKQRRFIEELDQIALEENEGNALINLVKRYAMDEPVEILYSLRRFDELARREMARVLALPGSKESKQEYIDLLYSIRQKTYFSDVSAHADEEQTKSIAERESDSQGVFPRDR